MNWIPCSMYTCVENYHGQCFGSGCRRGGCDGCERDVDDDGNDEDESEVM